MEIVGEGAFGSVSVCRYNPDLVDKTIKVASASSLELERLASFCFGHVSLVDVDQVFRTGDELHIVMLRYPFDVYKYMHTNMLTFSLADTLKLERQIGSALQYMHEQRILHGDVKPENILMDTGKNFYLTDFSLSMKIGEEMITGCNQLYTSPFRPPILFYNDSVADGHMLRPGFDFFALFMTMCYIRFHFQIARGNDKDSTYIKNFWCFKLNMFPKIMRNDFKDVLYRDTYFKVFEMCF